MAASVNTGRQTGRRLWAEHVDLALCSAELTSRFRLSGHFELTADGRQEAALRCARLKFFLWTFFGLRYRVKKNKGVTTAAFLYC